MQMYITSGYDFRFKKNKYHNNKVSVDGIRFDSMKEARRYQELNLLLKSGDISDLKRQVKYVLIPSQREDGKKGKVIERECSYFADFVYFDNNLNKLVVEDTKGLRTKDYIIKRKLMLYIHGIRITEL